jgi:very-short-patch-repair endonuclease
MDEQKAKWGEAIVNARRMRQRSTATERVLWRHLRGRRLCGLKFRWQHPIVDFCCPELKLVLELDGGVHGEPDQEAADKVRQRAIEAAGFDVIRLANDAISQDLEATLDSLRSTLRARLSNRGR